MQHRNPITFKVTQEEETLIKETAKASSLPTATLVRFLVLQQIQNNIKEVNSQ